MTIIEIAKDNNWFQFHRQSRECRTFVFSSSSRELLEIPKGGTPVMAVTARITASDIIATDWEYV